MHLYKTEQILPIDISTAWAFFSSAKNLSLITPPELDFKILTNLNDKEIYEGMLIEYKVRPLLRLQVRWKTEICKVERPWSFTDRQLKGPYKMWEHTHTFIERNSGVIMIDEVKYKLPLGIVGRIVHTLFVRRKVASIFNYRRQILHKIFVDNK